MRRERRQIREKGLETRNVSLRVEGGINGF